MGDAIAHHHGELRVSPGRTISPSRSETRKERTRRATRRWRAFFREYELYYVVADEPDLITGVRHD